VGRASDAEASLRNALDVDPTNAPAHFNLGVLLGSERLDEVIVWCRKAAELRKGEPEYACTLAVFSRQSGDGNGAADRLRQLIADHSAHGDVYVLLGTIYEKLERLDDLRALCRDALANEALPPATRKHFADKLSVLSRRSE